MRAPETHHDGALAAYGLRLEGLGAGGLAAPPDWPTWRVVQEVGAFDDAEGMEVRTGRARVGLPGAGEIRIDREAASITYATRRPLPRPALIHPGLVPAAAIVNWWAGRACIHGAAFLHGDHAWCLVAEREGGKSTTAALLADRGRSLLTDDMLIVEGTRCFAGPPSVDLRPDAADHLGGESLGRVGTRERWRKRVELSVLEAPLAGFVVLEWSQDDPGTARVATGERVATVERHASLPPRPEHLLELASLPMLRLDRPRGLDGASRAVERLLAAIDEIA